MTNLLKLGDNRLIGAYFDKKQAKMQNLQNAGKLYKTDIVCTKRIF
jgi:hypothetical protein